MHLIAQKIKYNKYNEIEEIFITRMQIYGNKHI